jgi:hypothetical protein
VIIKSRNCGKSLNLKRPVAGEVIADVVIADDGLGSLKGSWRWPKAGPRNQKLDLINLIVIILCPLVCDDNK